MHKMISALLQRKYFVCNIPIPLKANSNEVKINRTLLVCGTGQIKAKCMMYNNCVFLRCNVNHYNAYFCIIHHCNTLTKCVDLRTVENQAFILKICWLQDFSENEWHPCIIKIYWFRLVLWQNRCDAYIELIENSERKSVHVKWQTKRCWWLVLVVSGH